jgi:hypothetical protein
MTAKSKAREPRSPKRVHSLDDWLQAEGKILGTQKQPKVKAAKGSKC